MITYEPVSRKHVEETTKEILIEKLDCVSIFTANFMHSHISDYYKRLSKKFNKIIIGHRERVKNGFKYLPLKEKINKINKIKPRLDRVAQLNNPNHPHIGVAKELAEEAFYEIVKIYSPILEENFLYN